MYVQFIGDTNTPLVKLIGSTHTFEKMVQSQRDEQLILNDLLLMDHYGAFKHKDPILTLITIASLAASITSLRARSSFSRLVALSLSDAASCLLLVSASFSLVISRRWLASSWFLAASRAEWLSRSCVNLGVKNGNSSVDFPHKLMRFLRQVLTIDLIFALKNINTCHSCNSLKT